MCYLCLTENCQTIMFLNSDDKLDCRHLKKKNQSSPKCLYKYIQKFIWRQKLCKIKHMGNFSTVMGTNYLFELHSIETKPPNFLDIIIYFQTGWYRKRSKQVRNLKENQERKDLETRLHDLKSMKNISFLSRKYNCFKPKNIKENLNFFE